MRAADRVWYDQGAAATMARMALAPAAGAYRVATWARNALYDRGVLRVEPPVVPAISIGNLGAGGTGKTPVAAWFARSLRDAGSRPAIVMRGYGGDEPLVHAELNPDVPVVVDADRAAGIRRAAQLGSNVAVLDDAFQHRRVARIEDVVLVSADTWREPLRLLPAGPWRELPRALRRATLVLVTRKAAARADAASLARRLAAWTATGAGAVASLQPGSLHHAITGEERPLAELRGERILLVTGIGDPEALAGQLRAAGADVTPRVFPDHHVYDSADCERLARDSASFGRVVCTLKDAVKLRSGWPRAANPPWYVSLRCGIEEGGAEVTALLHRVLSALPQHDLQAG